PVVKAAWAAAWAVSSRVAGAASAAPALGITRGKTSAPATSREQIRFISNSSFFMVPAVRGCVRRTKGEPYTFHPVEGQESTAQDSTTTGRCTVKFSLKSDQSQQAGGGG